MHLLDLACAQLEYGIGDEAEGQTVGDGVGERHHQRGDDCRYGFGGFIPLHFRQVTQHQAGHEQQRRRSGIAGHHTGQRRDEQAGQEQHGNRESRQTGTAAGLHTGSALHIGGGAGGTQDGAHKDRARIGQQRAVETPHALRHQQAGATRHAHQRAGGIKQFHQEEHQHHVEEARGQRRLDVELHEGGLDGGRCREDAVEGIAAEEERGHRHGQDADQQGARHLETVQHHDQQKAQQRHDDLGLVQIAQRHIGVLVGRNHTGGLERDQRQEKTQTHGDGNAYGLRYALDDELTQAQHGADQEQTSRDEHRPQGSLPRIAHLEHHHVGKIGVQPHARRQRNRVVGIQRHDGRAQRCDQAGGDKDRALGHARIPQNGGVDEHDVGH